MKNYAIISEFNPFHSGHKYLIEQCKNMGATHITAIMSGNFVQRGDFAIFPKHIRTKLALLCGVDLVIELPLPFALANAQTFARGGVQIANSMGCVSHLAFGSECGNVEILKNITEIFESKYFKEIFKSEFSKGISYPDALGKAIKKYSDNEIYYNTMSSPNNILGIEYIKALNGINSEIRPTTIKRIGDGYNSDKITSKFTNATNIRNLIYNKKDFTKYIPDECTELFAKAINNTATIENNIRGLFLQLRNISIQELSEIADIKEGLENKIFKSIHNSTNLNELISNIKSKRYTHARIMRIIISCLLNVKKEYTQQEVPYIRILGFNKRGTEILSQLKKTAKLPIVTKITKTPENFSEYANSLLNLEIHSTDIYNLFTSQIFPCGEEYRNGIIRV